MKSKILVIGHRGANSLAPENTLKSFQKAIELQADYIEFDVHESKDGEIVIIHDANTLRTTGKLGLVHNMTLKELRELDFREGEQIPTLGDLIKIAKGKIGLNCEIKANGIAHKIVTILQDANIIDSTIISSFKHEELLKIQDLEPNLKIAPLGPTKTGWITNWFSRKNLLKFTHEHQFYAINPFHKIVNKRFVKKAHDDNIKIFPWTANSTVAIKKLIELDVDGIITNDIIKLKNILNQTKIS